MAAPTDLLNEDVKELKGEIRDIRDNLSILKADVHRIDVGLAEIKSELRVLIGVATWGVRLATGAVALTITTLITSAFGAAWWASSINSEVKNLAVQVADVRKAVDGRQPVPVIHQEPPPIQNVPKP